MRRRLIKRVLVVLLVMCFINFANFVAMPNLAVAEEKTDDEKRADRYVAAVGLIALALLWMASTNAKKATLGKQNKIAIKNTDPSPTDLKKEEQSMQVALDFAQSGYYKGFDDEHIAESKGEWRSPELKVGFAW